MPPQSRQWIDADHVKIQGREQLLAFVQAPDIQLSFDDVHHAP